MAKTTTSKKNASKKETEKNLNKKTPAQSKSNVKSSTTKTKKSKPKTTIVQEENNYGRTLIASIIIILIFVGGFIAVKYRENLDKNEKTYVATADEKKFKKEYESLNGTTRSNGLKNKDVTIMEDNNIKYITPEEAATMLDSGTGIIYFGYAACPWCRNAVPVLLNAMNSSELDTIYYVNVRPDDDPSQDIRDLYTLNNKNKAKKSKDADQSYYDIVLALASELREYELTTDSGKKVSTGVRRLYTPTVVAVKDGVLVGFHEGTVKDHETDKDGVLRDLTKDEENELLNTYTSIISKYLDTSCDEDNEGC